MSTHSPTTSIRLSTSETESPRSITWVNPRSRGLLERSGMSRKPAMGWPQPCPDRRSPQLSQRPPARQRSLQSVRRARCPARARPAPRPHDGRARTPRRSPSRSEEHTSELQSHSDLVCRLLLEKKKKKTINTTNYKICCK